MANFVGSRIALGVSYHGERWKGWQTQPHRQTIQDEFELALASFAGTKIDVHCAGRTDAGVHAAMQVVHLDAPVQRSFSAWVRGVNAYLPWDIRVRWAQSVADDFHARFSALARSYVYVLLIDEVMSPLWNARAGWSFRPLDVAAMHQAAQHFIGEHDFSSFRASDCQSVSPVREIYHFNVTSRGRFVYFHVRGNAFLHHMVRNMVGSLVYVGLGKYAIDHIQTLLDVKDRSQAAPTFSPAGLYLTSVEYPSHYGLTQCDVSHELLQGY